MPIEASACLMAAWASDSEAPAPRLKEMVVAADWSWWEMEVAAEDGPKLAMADSGTSRSMAPEMAGLVEAPALGGAAGPARVWPEAPELPDGSEPVVPEVAEASPASGMVGV